MHYVSVIFNTDQIIFAVTEIEEMRKQMEEEMKKNQEEMEAMKKSWEERMKEQNNANAVSRWLLIFFLIVKVI